MIPILGEEIVVLLMSDVSRRHNNRIKYLVLILIRHKLENPDVVFAQLAPDPGLHSN